MRFDRMLAVGLVGGLSFFGADALAGPAPSALQVEPIAAADPGSSLPGGWQHGVFIEIYVRGYRDSNGDGIGDLRGLTQSLDYLQRLGVRGIWLMPVNASQDHDHGYAVSDYRGIEPAYGTLADFDELLAQAHARGIGVIFDYVINHSAATHPAFVDASLSPDSPYRSWYVWQPVAPTGWKILGKDPWVRTPNGAYLAQFSKTMPDFNFGNPEVLRFHEDNLRFWLNRGVDGFRFDAVAHLVESGPEAWYDQPGNYQVMGAISTLVHSYAGRYVVCEATKNALRYARDNACGGAFALDRAPQLVDAARGKASAIERVGEYFTHAPGAMATMLSNHDLFAGERLWDQVKGDQAQYRLAAATYLLQPGTPFIYYGEEIGMSAAAGLQGDAKLRTPMSWSADPVSAGFSSITPYRATVANASTQNVAVEDHDPASLLNYYRTLIALRNKYPSLASGDYSAPFVRGKVMGFQRRLGEETALVLVNYDLKRVRIAIPDVAAGSKFVQVFPAAAADTPATSISLEQSASIEAQSVRVFVSRQAP